MLKLLEQDRKALKTALSEICYAGCRIDKYLGPYAENDLYLKELMDQLTQRPIVAMIKLKDYLGLREENESNRTDHTMHKDPIS